MAEYDPPQPPSRPSPTRSLFPERIDEGREPLDHSELAARIGVWLVLTCLAAILIAITIWIVLWILGVR